MHKNPVNHEKRFVFVADGKPEFEMYENVEKILIGFVNIYQDQTEFSGLYHEKDF